MLGLTLLTVCCALTVSNAMHQQFMFGSDQLTIPSFVEDVLRNPHFTPFTWIIPRATYAFPDLAGYFLVRLVTGDAYVALTIYSILHVVAVAFAAKLLLDRAFTDRRQARFAVLSFLALSGTTLGCIVIRHGQLLYWPFGAIAHASAAVSALVMFCVYKSIIDTRALWKHLLAAAICAVLIFSDKFFLVFFCAPYASALLLTGIGKPAWRTLTIFMAEMVAALAVSLWIDSLFVQQWTEPLELTLLHKHFAMVAKMVWNLGALPWLWLLAGAVAAAVLAWRAGPFNQYAIQIPLGARRARIFAAALTGFGFAVGVVLCIPNGAYDRYMVGLDFGALLCAATLMVELTPERRWARFGVVTLMILAVILATASAHLVSPLLPFAERREITEIDGGLSRQISA